MGLVAGKAILRKMENASHVISLALSVQARESTNALINNFFRQYERVFPFEEGHWRAIRIDLIVN